MERLQKVIANSGITSRRKAEVMIQEGRVKVNGIKVKELGVKVSTKDKVEVDDILISKKDHVYFLLNKPRGVISSVEDDKKRKTVVDLIETETRIYPVGRLDYDTTGAILLTNDGTFANIIMHPQYEIDKVYIAKIRGLIKGDSIKKLKEGMIVEGRKMQASKVKLRKSDATTNTSIVELTIHEGHNHQVKNMFAAVGYEVLKLKRKRIGIFTIDNLKSGEYRRLTPKEVQIIYSLEKR